MVSGYLGDRVSLKLLVSSGMVLTSIGYGIIVILGFSNANYAYLFIIVFSFIGFAQSTVWPGTLAIMSN